MEKTIKKDRSIILNCVLLGNKSLLKHFWVFFYKNIKQIVVSQRHDHLRYIKINCQNKKIKKERNSKLFYKFDCDGGQEKIK